jgi:hypothetical protein
MKNNLDIPKQAAIILPFLPVQIMMGIARRVAWIGNAVGVKMR